VRGLYPFTACESTAFQQLMEGLVDVGLPSNNTLCRMLDYYFTQKVSCLRGVLEDVKFWFSRTVCFGTSMALR
jgi:hypothetical protein